MTCCRLVFVSVACALAASSVTIAAALEGNQGRNAGVHSRPSAGWNNKAPWAGRELTSDSPRANRKDPVTLFDNVYDVGLQSVSSYLVTTSNGLVLIDATYPETADFVLGSVRALGFDPSAIKYVLVTHSHLDHFGGAGRIQQVTRARVGMSRDDWQSVERQQQRVAAPSELANSGSHATDFGVLLKRDLILNDNDALRVGDTTFRFYVTPGHTAGATSIAYEVRDHGMKYRALSPGGLGVNFGPDWTTRFISGLQRLKALGPWDVILSNHPWLMPRNLADIEKDLKTRRPGQPHPAVLGWGQVTSWFDAILTVAREKLASEQN